MSSKLLSAGRALGKAQGGAAKAAGLERGLGNMFQGIGTGVQNYQANVEKQKQQAAAESLGVKLGIEPNTARNLDTSDLLRMLAQRNEQIAIESRQRGLADLDQRHRLLEMREKFTLEDQRENREAGYNQMRIRALFPHLASEQADALAGVDTPIASRFIDQQTDAGRRAASVRVGGGLGLDPEIAGEIDPLALLKLGDDRAAAAAKPQEPMVTFGPDGKVVMPQGQFPANRLSDVASILRATGQDAEGGGPSGADPEMADTMLKMLRRVEVARTGLPVTPERETELAEEAKVMASSYGTSERLERLIPNQRKAESVQGGRLLGVIKAEAASTEKAIARIDSQINHFRRRDGRSDAPELRALQQQRDELVGTLRRLQAEARDATTIGTTGGLGGDNPDRYERTNDSTEFSESEIEAALRGLEALKGGLRGGS